LVSRERDDAQLWESIVHKRGETDDFGATRITAHPILGDLTPVPLVEFTFDGATVSGREGEPIAAALFAAGYRVLRTMPRFGDARGGYCMIGRCADCLIVVDGVPNVPACRTPVSAGQAVRTQHGLGETASSEVGERDT
jgi:2Fe-2S iron-sulfur cluster binding domain